MQINLQPRILVLQIPEDEALQLMAELVATDSTNLRSLGSAIAKNIGAQPAQAPAPVPAEKLPEQKPSPI